MVMERTLPSSNLLTNIQSRYAIASKKSGFYNAFSVYRKNTMNNEYFIEWLNPNSCYQHYKTLLKNIKIIYTSEVLQLYFMLNNLILILRNSSDDFKT